tara:strand:+ start:164 stop:604 length:441 start_codon:yes stop_codon:yes gene_type:complete
MDLLETYNKNKKKHLLKEVSVSGETGTFIGAPGDFIDQKFAGPFHKEWGDLKKLLHKQVEGDISKRMYSDDITPLLDPDFYEIDWKYEYDKYVKEDNSKFKSNNDTEMQLVDMEIKYDEIEDKTEENKKFINDTSNWKSIYDNKKY